MFSLAHIGSAAACIVQARFALDASYDVASSRRCVNFWRRYAVPDATCETSGVVPGLLGQSSANFLTVHSCHLLVSQRFTPCAFSFRFASHKTRALNFYQDKLRLSSNLVSRCSLLVLNLLILYMIMNSVLTQTQKHLFTNTDVHV